jgi:hypothetical protein
MVNNTLELPKAETIRLAVAAVKKTTAGHKTK